MNRLLVFQLAAVLTASFAVFLAPPPASARILRVPGGFPTVEQAIDSAVPHDTVLVSPGTYRPTRQILFSRPSVALVSEVRRQATILNLGVYQMPAFIHIKSDSCLLQGFEVVAAGSAWTILEISGYGGGSYPRDGVRIIDNAIEGNSLTVGMHDLAVEGTQILGNDISHCLDPIWSESNNVVIDSNQLIQNFECGIAVARYYTAANPLSARITNNSVVGTYGHTDYGGVTTHSGPGITVFGANGVIYVSGNQIENNIADGWSQDWGEGHGGGLFIWRSTGVTVEGNRIQGNQALNGAGIFAGESDVVIRNNLVCANQDSVRYEENTLRGRGGGLLCDNSQGRVENNTFASNEALIEGAAVYLDNSPEVALAGNIFALNSGAGSGLYATGGAPSIFGCNDAWLNGQVNYGGWIDPTGVQGNINADPLFCPSFFGDYTLRDDSPCAPSNSPPECGLIGAYDVSCNAADAPDGYGMSSGAMIHIIPNPARDQVTIGISGSEAALRTVVILDAGGRAIRTLRGGSALVWDLRDERGNRASSGAYFVRWRSAGRSLTSKFLVVQ